MTTDGVDYWITTEVRNPYEQVVSGAIEVDWENESSGSLFARRKNDPRWVLVQDPIVVGDVVVRSGMTYPVARNVIAVDATGDWLMLMASELDRPFTAPASDYQKVSK
jgi:hypothetical protein